MMLLWSRAILGQCFKSKLEIFIPTDSSLVKESNETRIRKNEYRFDTKLLLETSVKLNIYYTSIKPNRVKKIIFSR